MAANKKKIVAFVAAAALVGGALVPCLAQLRTTEPARTSIDNSATLFAADSNILPQPADDTGTSELFFKMMQAVGLVVVLGAAAIYFTKKFLPKITNLPGKKICITETVALGPRKALHLLEIGNRRLLIGSTVENITMLADVTQAPAEEDVSMQQTDDNPGI